MQNKKSIIIPLAFFLCFVLAGAPAKAEIIFQDDFNSIESGWNCSDPIPPGWSSKAGCSSATLDGITHYGSEITTGSRSGNSFKFWRHSSFSTGYNGGYAYHDHALFNAGKEIYNRWYMKVPSDFETTGSMNYLKLWRYLVGPSSGVLWGTQEVYLNFNGATFSKANMQVGTVSVPGTGWKQLAPVSDVRDGLWHCHELRIKLSSSGNADGEIEYWLDGIQKAFYQNLDFGYVGADDYFSASSFGIGNTAASGFQSAWRAIEFDDYVLSTTYIGPVEEIVSLPGDLNSDGVVDIFDYNIFLQHFGVTEDCQNSADLNGDCSVNIFDYNILLENFGKNLWDAIM